jgi:hypothetical protein
MQYQSRCNIFNSFGNALLFRYIYKGKLVKISANIVFLFYKKIYMKYLILYYKSCYPSNWKSLIVLLYDTFLYAAFTIKISFYHNVFFGLHCSLVQDVRMLIIFTVMLKRNMMKYNCHRLKYLILCYKRVITLILRNIVPRSISYSTRKLVQYDILLGTIFLNISAIILCY